MANDYFSHDYNSRNDKQLVKVFMKYGLSGIGAYWCIVEMLYEEGGYLMIDEYERITFELRADYDMITDVIKGFELFIIDDVKFWSETALNRLKLRAEKSQKARESIEKRWNKYDSNTNVSRTKNDSNTIKGKERKGNKSKEKYYREFAHLKISVEENNRLLEIGYSQNEVNLIYDSIENYKKNNNYKSLYLTSIKWLKKEYPGRDKVNKSLPLFRCTHRFGNTKDYEVATEEEARQKYFNYCGDYPREITKLR